MPDFRREIRFLFSNMRDLTRITILGPGLLGGSVGLAARDAGLDVVLWGRKGERVEAARRLGLQGTTSLEEAVTGRDLIVFAVPVGAMDALATRVAELIGSEVLVTDVGSVKRLPHKVAEARGLAFIGSHPMAGSEVTGIEAAGAELLNGAVCVMTNDQNRIPDEVSGLEAFWKALGCRVVMMNCGDHDRSVARISHLPHAMAVATAAAGLKTCGDSSLAGGGFRDTTRVASGDPAMWAEIMMENRMALTSALEDARNEIGEMLAHLANSDQKGLETYLETVKQRKENPTAIT